MTENLFPYPDFLKIYAILDHCREVQVLSDQERVLKATKDASKESVNFLHGKLNNELADLALLLENYFNDKPALLKSRREKIRGHHEEDKKWLAKIHNSVTKK
ncbi:MAG: hypothetical protein FWC61_04365 [Proteobacteria bacterium]|nr:hypothetical protein [Pseudomonadota bacterium]